MSIEQRLREAIDEHIGDPRSDDLAWAGIQRKIGAQPGSAAEPHHVRGQRLLAAAVAVIVFAVVAVGLGLAIRYGTSSTPAAGNPPAWVVDKALQMASSNGDAAPTSAEWALSDAATIQQAFGYINAGEPDHAYVVILRGQFTANGPAPPGAPAPRGSLLFLVLDPASHNVTDWGVENHEVSLPGLAPLPLVADQVLVPDLVGLSLADAKSALEPMGFAVEVQRRTDANPVGTVSRQSPAAGDAAPFGSVVKLVVSDGLPGNYLGNLDCPSEQQSAEIIEPSIKLVPLSSAETVPELIRRTFSGIDAGDQVTTSTSEGGTFVVISRSGATIARAFLTPHLQEWMLAAVSACADSGVTPPT